MQYIKIYTAANSTEAHLIKGLLKQESIHATIIGEKLSVAVGALPTDVLQVDILVEKEKYEDALEIILKYEKILGNSARDGESWECDSCNKINPEVFNICWSCQGNRLTVA